MAAVGTALAIQRVFAVDPLPPPDREGAFEVEPPLLVPRRERDGSIPDPAGSAAAVHIDLAKLETEVARAQERAAAGERLFKAGIIAKADAEQRALKVVQLKAALAEARWQQAKAEADEAGETAADTVLAEASQRAAEERHRAEVEQALRNLQRQQKLFALGSARKRDVNRAEDKLAELRSAP